MTIKGARKGLLNVGMCLAGLGDPRPQSEELLSRLCSGMAPLHRGSPGIGVPRETFHF